MHSRHVHAQNSNRATEGKCNLLCGHFSLLLSYAFLTLLCTPGRGNEVSYVCTDIPNTLNLCCCHSTYTIDRAPDIINKKLTCVLNQNDSCLRMSNSFLFNISEGPPFYYGQESNAAEVGNMWSLDTCPY